MSEAEADLAALRAEIDRIDAALLDGLLRRVDVVERIKAAKAAHGGGFAFRPGREAMVLRSLAARSEGRFPLPALVRVWREVIAAFTYLQTPFEVAVMAGLDGAVRDAARDHFGALVPIRRVDNPAQAMRALDDDRVRLAVLPLPDEGGADGGWWRWLMGTAERERVQVLAKLPFVEPAMSGGGGGGGDAYLVGSAALERTGDDAALVGIEAGPDLSRARLRARLEDAGMAPLWRAVSSEGETVLHLIELDGFIDDALARLPDALNDVSDEVLRVRPVGGYARPLRA